MVDVVVGRGVVGRGAAATVTTGAGAAVVVVTGIVVVVVDELVELVGGGIDPVNVGSSAPRLQATSSSPASASHGSVLVDRVRSTRRVSRRHGTRRRHLTRASSNRASSVRVRGLELLGPPLEVVPPDGRRARQGLLVAGLEAPPELVDRRLQVVELHRHAQRPRRRPELVALRSAQKPFSRITLWPSPSSSCAEPPEPRLEAEAARPRRSSRSRDRASTHRGSVHGWHPGASRLASVVFPDPGRPADQDHRDEAVVAGAVGADAGVARALRSPCGIFENPNSFEAMIIGETCHMAVARSDTSTTLASPVALALEQRGRDGAGGAEAAHDVTERGGGLPGGPSRPRARAWRCRPRCGPSGGAVVAALVRSGPLGPLPEPRAMMMFGLRARRSSVSIRSFVRRWGR